MKSPDTLRDLFIMKIIGLIDVEQQIQKALPKMIKNTDSEELKMLLNGHLEETKIQEARLEEIIESLDEKSSKVKTEGIRGILEDSEWRLKNIEEPALLNFFVLTVVNDVEHYEIASYETAVLMAETLGEEKAVELLSSSLVEEEKMSETLAEMAEEMSGELAGDIMEQKAVEDDE